MLTVSLKTVFTNSLPSPFLYLRLTVRPNWRAENVSLGVNILAVTVDNLVVSEGGKVLNVIGKVLWISEGSVNAFYQECACCIVVKSDQKLDQASCWQICSFSWFHKQKKKIKILSKKCVDLFTSATLGFSASSLITASSSASSSTASSALTITGANRSVNENEAIKRKLLKVVFVLHRVDSINVGLFSLFKFKVNQHAKVQGRIELCEIHLESQYFLKSSMLKPELFKSPKKSPKKNKFFPKQLLDMSCQIN
ncbi:hypothetical protein BpHYR1_038948 [Brachionus plicatilis]|uniref:Uncharacterized protein n=1 Tax=Brachionus plicatilis TaxID=10195 RepID=A0A3M7PLM8_BRAPC|nr:hypothetical protein BpHYR1_038948 [Brachionus plicatilis]